MKAKPWTPSNSPFRGGGSKLPPYEGRAGEGPTPLQGEEMDGGCQRENAI